MNAVLHDPPRPFVRISSPGTLDSGQRYFILHYFPVAAEGGGEVNVWDGTSYDEAILMAHDWECDGIPCFDNVGGSP